LRVLDRSAVNLDLDTLGFPKYVHDYVTDAIQRPNGIFIVTGPTGCGKTTTLYSCLRRVNTMDSKLLTAEDPVEYDIEGIMQVAIHEAVGMTFAKALRSFLRQDPDIIMVGEIRDLETADMAIQAALTGHLVLSTLHTNDAPAAITRLLDLGVPPYLISSTVLGIMAQRLVRTLCPKCKQPYPLREEEIEQWDALVAPWKTNRPAQFHHQVGCLECRMTGYQGRVGIYEILLMSPELRKLVVPNADAARIRELAYREGMRPLRISGAMKVAAGATTLDEVIKVAPPANQL